MIARIASAIADYYMDVFVRLSLMEAAVGVTPGTFTRGPQVKGLASARAALPTWDEHWFSNKEQGLYAAVHYGAQHKGLLSEEDVDDLVADLISDPRVYSALVRAKGSTLPPMSGLGVAAKQLRWFSTQKVISAYHRRRHEVPDQVDVSELQNLVADPVDVLDALGHATVRSGFRRWLLSVWTREYGRAEGKMNILQMWLANPDLSATDIAEALGLNINRQSGRSDPTYVARVLRDAAQVAIRAASRGDVPSAVVNALSLLDLERGAA